MLAMSIAPNYARPVDAKAVGRNLKTIRESREQTQEQVAAKLAVKQGRISNWERGRYKSFDMKTLIGLAKAYETTVEDLLAGVDNDYDTKRELIRHAHLGSSSAARSQRKGTRDDDGGAAQADVLAAERRQHAATIKAVKDLADEIVEILIKDVERRPADAGTPGAAVAQRRRHPRAASRSVS